MNVSHLKKKLKTTASTLVAVGPFVDPSEIKHLEDPASQGLNKS
jgi:hypothetical protein